MIPSREGGFWQLSYTHQMKSRTEYVREEEVDVVRGNSDCLSLYTVMSFDQGKAAALPYQQSR